MNYKDYVAANYQMLAGVELCETDITRIASVIHKVVGDLQQSLLDANMMFDMDEGDFDRYLRDLKIKSLEN